MAGAHKLNFEGGHQKRNIEKMEGHGNFNMQDLADDISIITVTEPFDFSDPNVQAIETFKTTDEEIAPGTTCISSGWGLTTGGGLFPPNTLQVVDLDIVSQEECNNIFDG